MRSKFNVSPCHLQYVDKPISLLTLKKTVVLYVANNNPAAAKVYSRVGFVGLGPESGPTEGVDQWLELGFDRQRVQLGHW